MHGARANIGAIKFLAAKLKPRSIAFEWPDQWQATIDTMRQEEKKDIPQIFSTLKDGRISLEHLSFLHTLKKDIRIYAVDTDNSSSWNERDKSIASRLTGLIKDSRNLPTLVILGRLHARKHNFVIHGEKYIPVGSLLMGDVTHIQMRYAGGAINNLGLVNLPRDKEAEKHEPHAPCLVPSLSKYFDLSMFLGRTTPVTLI